ncbi:MAG: DUF5615 family PIN-like protein [Chloroflexota bacterium]|nr:DUF5615 family PIN-like protein [Chloroflexota bacterium]
MVSLYLDENLAKSSIARQLQAAGFSIYTPQASETRTFDDPPALDAATQFGAVLVTYNKGDFEKLHKEWQAAGRDHAGILRSHRLSPGDLIAKLERAARLLTPDIARNQLMELSLFDHGARARRTSSACVHRPSQIA